MQAPPLPRSFPCWVKAIYSWGGETKRDLGFIEGDLIECLNAGDGSWWMGRLKRDKRQVGLFPSNFVEVVEDFRPVSPAPPTQQQRQSRSRAASPNPGTFDQRNSGRTPSPHPPIQLGGFLDNNNNHYRASSPNPQQVHSRGPSPNPYQQQYTRGASPSPYQQQHSRGPSPNPYQQNRSTSPYPSHDMRAPSPNPYQHNNGNNFQDPYNQYRAASPQPYQNVVCPAPQHPFPNHLNQDPNGYARAPSPNPMNMSRGPSPNPYQQQQQEQSISRGPSPSPYHHHHQQQQQQQQQQNISRNTSPAPYSTPYRARSPAPLRAVSPTPGRMLSRAPSHMRYDQEQTPPPMPPTHGRTYSNSRVPSPCPSFNNQHNGHLTPAGSRSASPNVIGTTPSPLRSAMDDIMSSLDGMSAQNGHTEPRRSHQWSSGEYNMPYDSPSLSNKTVRAQTSLGLRHDGDDGYAGNGMNTYHNNQSNHTSSAQHSYVDVMEERLRNLQMSNPSSDLYYNQNNMKPSSAIHSEGFVNQRKSFWDMKGDTALQRQETTRSNGSSTANSSTSTNTTSTAPTSYSLMSGMSAGGFSATSAGSLARSRHRAMTAGNGPTNGPGMSLKTTFEEPNSRTIGSGGVTYFSGSPSLTRENSHEPSDPSIASVFGGLSMPSSPNKRKSGFFKKIIASAKASTATARSVAHTGSDSGSSAVNSQRIIGITGGSTGSQISNDWVQVRRDVNRSNTLSRNERLERQEKQEMMDQLIIRPVDSLDEDVDGDEAADGGIVENAADFSNINMALVDKSARFVGNLSPGTTPAMLANGHICRPYRTDVQRLRAIFTWTAEKISWEHPVAPIDDGPADSMVYQVDCRRVIQTHRGTPEEIAVLVLQMCHSIGIGCEIVRGYLKAPGESIDLEVVPRPNHHWNAVVIDGEWRIIDASLASPTHPRRAHYSAAQGNVADFFYFLTSPTQACYTHIPMNPAQQHLVPPLPLSTLLALPCATSVYFKNNLDLLNYDTSLTRIEGLEIVQIDFKVPLDVEAIAEVEANGFAVDADGDLFESGEVVKKGALAQVTWEGGWGKTYRVKAVLPADEGHGVLKIYAGPRGLMHSNKDNPHPLAFALPISHTGENPTYNFVTRHPTPHAQRHDLYIIQPQNLRLAMDNTYVFSIRQHSSSVLSPSQAADPTSGKPAKLAVQTPGGKIVRLLRKGDTMGADAGTVWESILKCAERGVWRGLVLADRSARWCVFAEWVCV